jgi:hypothetical protein
MKLSALLLLLMSSYYANAKAPPKLQACGKVKFSEKMTCEKPEVNFEISECEKGATEAYAPTSLTCERGEMVAILRTKENSFRAVFSKSYSGGWSQKGKVWKFSLRPAVAKSRKVSSEIVKESPATPSATVVSSSAAQGKPAIEAENTEKAETIALTPLAPAVPTAETWAFKFSGWFFAEYESFENFGDGVTTQFSDADPFSRQQDTNLLANLQFNASKGPILFQSIFEIGEVFFGEATTGGSQGLRKNNIEVRNLFVQEELWPDWFFKVGMWSVLSDPRGFILSDHHTGFQLRYESQDKVSEFWYADAAGAKPGTAAIKDSYLGLKHAQPYGKSGSLSVFGVYRSTRESFVDTDLVTTLDLGKSEYSWVGINNLNRDVGRFNFEANAIASQAKFKADSGQSDSNMGWLAHVKVDSDFSAGWNLSLEGLGTSGENDSRVGTVKTLGKRKNFSSPDPSAAYLLTVVTNDGGDDAPGSVQQSANVIGRLDLDEGLRILVVTANKSFGEKVESFLRYGTIKSASKRLLTGSDDFGSEIDFQIKLKSDNSTSWTFDHGVLSPGSFHVNRDRASLTTLRYKLEF